MLSYCHRYDIASSWGFRILTWSLSEKEINSLPLPSFAYLKSPLPPINHVNLASYRLIIDLRLSLLLARIIKLISSMDVLLKIVMPNKIFNFLLHLKAIFGVMVMVLVKVIVLALIMKGREFHRARLLHVLFLSIFMRILVLEARIEV